MLTMAMNSALETRVSAVGFASSYSVISTAIPMLAVAPHHPVNLTHISNSTTFNERMTRRGGRNGAKDERGCRLSTRA